MSTPEGLCTKCGTEPCAEHASKSLSAPAPALHESDAITLLRRLRGWDMFNPPTGPGAVADAPYWVSEIDRVLAALPLPPQETCEHEFVTHMIQMPEGYSKPGATRCRKCGEHAPIQQHGSLPAVPSSVPQNYDGDTPKETRYMSQALSSLKAAIEQIPCQVEGFCGLQDLGLCRNCALAGKLLALLLAVEQEQQQEW